MDTTLCKSLDATYDSVLLRTEYRYMVERATVKLGTILA